MKKLITALIATTLALATAGTALVPADAAPLRLVTPNAAESTDVIQVRDLHGVRRSPAFRNRGSVFRGHGNVFRGHGVAKPGWRGGYRGYRDYRPGYRRSGNYWFPAAAFAAGALATGVIINSQQSRVGSSHVQWCYDRYRSYRASDNTFQPNDGPRQQCVSP